MSQSVCVLFDFDGALVDSARCGMLATRWAFGTLATYHPDFLAHDVADPICGDGSFAA